MRLPWVSDADKTVEMMMTSTDTESEAFQTTRALLGKMTVSFSPTEVEFTLNGQVDRVAYRVLASDDYSCVIESIDDMNGIDEELADIMRFSTFDVIHFEDQNSYSVHSQLGGFVEYFRRIP